MRQAAEAPKAKASAATTAPTGCQPRSRNRRITAAPPSPSIPSTTASAARKPGSGVMNARSRCGGRVEIDEVAGAVALRGEIAHVFGGRTAHHPLFGDDGQAGLAERRD